MTNLFLLEKNTYINIIYAIPIPIIHRMIHINAVVVRSQNNIYIYIGV